MRKIAVLSCLLALALMSSCSSLFLDASSSSETETAVVFETDPEPVPEYRTQIYSSPSDACLNPDKVIVLCDTMNFLAQRPTEAAIADAFSDAGIESLLSSDIAKISDYSEESVEDLIMKLMKHAVYEECRYLLVVSFTSIRQYALGEGIKELYFEFYILDLSNSEPSLSGSGVIESVENMFLSFPETLKPVCQKLGEAIAEEYLKHVGIAGESSTSESWGLLHQKI